jgi:hypothetical protein
MLLCIDPKNDALTSFLRQSSMTASTITALRPARKLLALIPETDLSRLVSETFALATAEPQLLEMIDRDRDAAALQKKRERIEDAVWYETRGKPLPGFAVDEEDGWASDMELGVGRPRMPALAVLLFTVVRGYLGGFKDRKAAMTLQESMTVQACMTSLGYSALPGASTMIDNANAVSAATLEALLDAQIRQALREKLDNFKKLTGDSTDVAANSAWPTESGLIMGLAVRCEHLIRLLADDGIVLKLPAVMVKLLGEIRDLNKQIQLSSGKKDGAKKRAKLYRKLLRAARKVLRAFEAARARADAKFDTVDVSPSRRRRLAALIEWIEVDVKNLKATIANADKRINKEQKVPICDKVLSLADQDAAMIVKGQREPVLGYKPQLMRSENGFVTAIVVPEGNAADSGQLRPLTDAAIKRTGVMPSVLSFDDGYSNGADRDHYRGLGIEVVSFSGSKGKNIISPAEYESEPYRAARNNRSSVESLMYTLKNNNELDYVMRRGIANVREELLGKVIAYNFFRLITLRQRHRERAAA